MRKIAAKMGRVTGRKPLLAGYGPDFPHYLKCMARTLRFFTCDSTTREAPGPPSNQKPPRQHCTEQCHTLKMTAPPNRRLIGLSTKMYFPLQRTLDFIITVQTQLAAQSSSLENVDIFIIPDFISIHPVSEALKSTSVPIRLGAQDCHWDDFGAFTGEVSPVVLRETGVSIVEVGHAERRRIFGETDEVVAKKAAAASRNGMAPLICIGEKTKGDLSIALGECQVQIDQSLADVPESAEVIIAYEPVWAIGASEPASEGHVIGVVKGIRAFESVKRRTGLTRVIYGGSAGPGLFEKLGEAVDGLFLGRFGHDVPRFLTTVSEVASLKA